MFLKDEDKFRGTLTRISRLCYSKGYVTADDGSMSARYGENRVLVTPDGLSKGLLQEQDLFVVDLDGKIVQGNGRPATDLPIHLAVYKARPDVRTVLHAKPPFCMAFAAAGKKLDDAVSPDIVVLFGSIPTVVYATPGSAPLAKNVAACAKEHDAMLIASYGLLTAAYSVQDCFTKLEKVESYAQLLYHAKQLGGAKKLPAPEMKKLRALHKAYFAQTPQR